VKTGGKKSKRQKGDLLQEWREGGKKKYNHNEGGHEVVMTGFQRKKEKRHERLSYRKRVKRGRHLFGFVWKGEKTARFNR